MTNNQDKAFCRFEKPTKTLTVGDVFDMQCEWPLHLAVLSSPVRVEFPTPLLQAENKGLDKQEANPALKNIKPLPKKTDISPYSLVILQTKNILPGTASFKVTSYQPGHYNTGLILISDSGQVLSHPLSWQVESVLPKEEQVKPYPPYGPWMEKLPFWYWPAGAFILICFLVFGAFKVRFFMKRKKKIQEVQKQYRGKTKTPYQTFIGQLNLLSWKAHQTDLKQEGFLQDIMKEIETAFRVFLEHAFFIDTFEKSPMVIVKQLKKNYPLVYQQHGKSILNFFIELKKLSKAKSEDVEQIINMVRQLAHFFPNQGGGKRLR